MSDQDDSQATSNASAEQPTETKELSFAEELAQANDKTSDDEQPETQVDEGAEQAQETEQTETNEPDDGQKPEESEQQETEAERKQRFYELRQQQKAERQKAKDAIQQTYQPQPVDELTQKFIDEGYSQFEAEMKAENERRNQQAEIDKASARIAELNSQINTEAVQVMHDFPVFDPSSPDYDKEFADKASVMYMRLVEVDPKSQTVIGVRETPYNFYKDLAEMHEKGKTVAQIKAQKAAEAQMAKVAPPTSTAPVVQKSKDDEEADRMRAAFDKA